jgi:hypothetical protein
MLHLVAPGYGSHRVHFAPRSPLDEQAMRGNVWKSGSKNPIERERQIRLLRYIGTNLSLPNIFVLFHIDGDRPWGERGSSENVAKFERLSGPDCRKSSSAVARTTPEQRNVSASGVLIRV